MSTSGTSYPGEVCQAVIEGIEEIAESMTTKRTQPGAVEGLISDYNRQSGQVEFVKSSGHVAQVDARYFQRAAGAATASVNNTTCTSSNVYGQKSDVFDVAQCTFIDFYFKEDYVARLCDGGNGGMLSKMLMGQWEDFVRKLNRDTLSTLAANFGQNVATGNSNQVTWDLLDAANNGQIIASAWSGFMDELKNGNQIGQAPVIIAGSSFWQFNMLRQAACCNDFGQDVGELIAQNGYAFFNDQMIDSVLGADEAIVLQPGSTHFVPWVKYQTPVTNNVMAGVAYGAYEMSNGEARGIVRDPFTGLPVNIKVFWNACEERYDVQLFLNWDIWTTPTDLYQAADHMNLFTGILDYKFT